MKLPNQKGFAHLILIIIVIGVLAAAGGLWYFQQSSKQTRDDLGCWPPSCSLIPDPGKQLCTDWKAGKEVAWPDCSFMASFPKCQQLCESEKKNNPQQANTVFDPNSSSSEPPAGSESFVMSMKEVPPACITGDEDHRAQLVYARPQDTGDRYDEMAPKIRKWIAQGNSIINDEAKSST